MKIPSNQENPFDIINIRIADILCAVFKTLKMSPNHITTLSLIFGVFAIICLMNYNFFGFAISFYISYIFDCMDGHYARKYDLVTKFGDYYDHIKDVVIAGVIIIVVIYKYKLPRKVLILFISFIFTTSFLLATHMGCQERLYKNSESPTLTPLKKLCRGDPNATIKYTRFFGCGTWVILFIFSVSYITRNREK